LEDFVVRARVRGSKCSDVGERSASRQSYWWYFFENDEIKMKWNYPLVS
jgi:hypothetical protein